MSAELSKEQIEDIREMFAIGSPGVIDTLCDMAEKWRAVGEGGEAVAWLVDGHRGRFATLDTHEAYGRSGLIEKSQKEGYETVAPLYLHPSPNADLAKRLPKHAFVFVNVPHPDLNGNIHRNVSESEYSLLRAWAIEAATHLSGGK